MVDCGAWPQRNYRHGDTGSRNFEFPEGMLADLDFIILSHPHVDHVGKLLRTLSETLAAREHGVGRRRLPPQILVNEGTALMMYMSLQEQVHYFNPKIFEGIAPWSGSTAGLVTEVAMSSKGGKAWDLRKPKVIISSSGMGEGKAASYIEHYSGDERNLVLLSCYQVKGCLGRQLLDYSQEETRAAGRFEKYRIRVEQHSLSAHSSGPDLARFLESVSNDGAKIVLTHGEPNNLLAMKGLLQENKKFSSIEVPSNGDRIPL